MKRECVLYRASAVYSRYVCLDEAVADEILTYIEDPKKEKKFDYIVNRILAQDFIYYDDYVKLKGYDHLSEMRLFPNGENVRIYCKEVGDKDGNYFIIAAKFLPKKKSEELGKSIDQMIKPIEKYEYQVDGIATANSGSTGEQN